MSVRSKRMLATSIVTATAQTTVFTVPANRTAIVHSAVLYLPGATPAEVRLILRTGNTSVDAVRQQFAAGAVARFLDLHAVLEAGDLIALQTAPTGLELRAWVSGSLLEGNPV